MGVPNCIPLFANDLGVLIKCMNSKKFDNYLSIYLSIYSSTNCLSIHIYPSIYLSMHENIQIKYDNLALCSFPIIHFCLINKIVVLLQFKNDSFLKLKKNLNILMN